MTTRINIVQHWVRTAAAALRDMWHNTDKSFEHGAIELEAPNILTAYEALGRALDELGVPRLKPEHCKHPEDLRERVNASADICKACGRVNAMVPTRSGAARKWVDADDPRIEIGATITQVLLENERRRIKERAGDGKA